MASIVFDAPIRGMRNVEGVLFVVAGNSLYEISSDITATWRGNIPGVTRVSMTHQQITNGYKLIVVNGTQGYVYNTVTQELNRITDESYPGAFVADFIDQYIVQVEPARRYWFHSELVAPEDYLSTDRYESEASPDRIVTLIVSHREIWVFGERTIEIYVNDPVGNVTFQRATGTVIEVGCGGRYTPARMDNSIFWLGNDGIIYRSDGYSPRRISTHAIEQEIADKNWANAFSMVWEDRGHKVYYLTFPDGKTFGYDAATGEWHRRESYGYNNWRVGHLTYWNNKWIAADRYSGALYEVAWDEYTEDGNPLVSERVTPYLHDGQNDIIMNYLEIVADVGGGGPVQPVFALQYSDDGGNNWTNWKQASLGEVGQYRQRVRFRRLGKFMNRVFRLQCSTPNRRDLIQASIQLDGGD